MKTPGEEEELHDKPLTSEEQGTEGLERKKDRPDTTGGSLKKRKGKGDVTVRARSGLKKRTSRRSW